MNRAEIIYAHVRMARTGLDGDRHLAGRLMSEANAIARTSALTPSEALDLAIERERRCPARPPERLRPVDAYVCGVRRYRDGESLHACQGPVERLGWADARDEHRADAEDPDEDEQP